jgi:MFS transporter, SP family, solute carrier family 2 (myo-inositol transporter), member 13
MKESMATLAAAPSLRPRPQARYNLLLQTVAGLGGLLYGVDIGIIGGALPYLEATSGLGAGQLATIVAAVLLGSVLSTIFAGALADWIGRKPMMLISGLVFVLSIPMIALSHGYTALFVGRLLQGASGGFIGVVVPLYLAECLSSTNRGKGTGMFQWLLTFGIVSAAVIGIYYSYRVQAVVNTQNAAAIFQVKDSAWRHIFWISLPPGVLFTLGALSHRAGCSEKAARGRHGKRCCVPPATGKPRSSWQRWRRCQKKLLSRMERIHLC